MKDSSQIQALLLVFKFCFLSSLKKKSELWRLFSSFYWFFLYFCFSEILALKMSMFSHNQNEIQVHLYFSKRMNETIDLRNLLLFENLLLEDSENSSPSSSSLICFMLTTSKSHFNILKCSWDTEQGLSGKKFSVWKESIWFKQTKIWFGRN